MTNLINDEKFLTFHECANLAEVIHQLEPYWELRSVEGFPFFTLGAASYLDARFGRLPYEEKAQTQNILLVTRLRQLYQILLSQLGIILQEPCFYADTTKALPGFHIFKSCEEFTKPVASKHVDKQYQLLAWSHTPQDSFSFTMPVELPLSGGGLNYFTTEGEHYWPYKVGTVTYFFGHILHQIAPFKEVTDEYRITLQGHGARINGRWQIYW